ncbi:M56 family metallopeptidase [Flavobacteriaceae bacterium S0825]|uniref:M56 family metallopeptidase n=1 Tax=Gaetbulibacter sp. S0825 TaxID=2720084 RepID=UPI00142F84DD|nr:M56 family metallopeptidase [Gaetbulibacter sp. S0825]MCK0107842.1 M56 family metallopeptidase [Flavobacteriaceae bacterium S0825]NIX63478.1 hypothetical protein [Gaetbulibacter sp. S0825]
MMQYIIQIVAFQIFFLLVYDVFLKKETFFNWNRFYLIGTSLLSLILPFVKVSAFKEIVPKDYIVSLPEVFIGNQTVSKTAVILPEVEITKQAFSWNLETLFYVGVVLASLLFLFKIIHIFLLIYKNPKQWKGNVLLVKLINSTSAFSFFHYVFLGANLKEEEQKVIIKHELVHVTQKHTLDLLFFEIQRIVFWFNPLVYMYQARIRSLHEFIADQEALKTQNKSDYYQNLLTQVFDTQNVSFINAFFKKSLIKKRIMMLSKSKSKQIVKFKYALLIPVVFVMLVFTTNAQTTSVSNTNLQEVSSENLKEKFYKELVQKEKEGVSLKKIADECLPNYNKYIYTKEEYYKFMAFQKFIDEDPRRLPLDAVDGLAEKIHNGFGIIKGDFDAFLAYKKTEKAKKEWEERATPNTIRMVIDDYSNLTDEERKEHDEKMELLKNNDFYEKLVIASEYFTATFSSPESDKQKEGELRMLNEVEVPYASIEQPPMFEDCETLPEEGQRKCTSDAISKHVQKNFNTKLANDLGLVGRQTIRAMFKINKEGNIVDVMVRAPHPKLEEETKRVIKSLPKMIPGKQKGKTVVVPYSLPIIFQVADKTDDKPSNNKIKHEEVPNKNQDIEVPYSHIEQPPMSKECKMLNSAEEQRKCTSQAVQKHVVKNFNTNLAGDLGLLGRQTIITMFKIDEKGRIVNIKARAPHPKLEEEAIRVIKSLPKMIPGKQKGKRVVVPFSLPIVFEVKESPNAIISYLTTENSNSKKDVEKQDSKEVPLVALDESPIYPGCDVTSSSDKLKECFKNSLANFISKEFGKNLQKNIDSEIEPRQKILAMFKIDKTGYIESIRVRAKHPELEKEAIRVLKALPKMTPGKHKGVTVIVPYSLPIMYELGEKKN